MIDPVESLRQYVRGTLDLLGYDPDEPHPRTRLQVIVAAWCREVLEAN